MKVRVLLIVMCLISLAVCGCQRGDFMLSPVVKGQLAPHAGYNIGPELYLEQGDRVIVTGAVIWIEGTDPNDLFE